MAESMTVRFSLGGSKHPTAQQVAAAMRDAVLEVKADGGVYEVTFEPAGGDEEDSLWLMICEIGASFPGAVIEE